MEQRTEDWFAIRCGRVTASRVADVIAKTKSGPSASRVNYCAQIVTERLTGKVEEGYSNAAMQWGTDQEAAARAAYAFQNAIKVKEAAFVVHPRILASGASPDGLVDDDGMVEIKCPNTATHIDTLLSEGVASKYVTQMQWQMACAGRDWCDFVSYDPRLPLDMQLFVKRIPRDDALIEELETEVCAFLGEVEAKIDTLKTKYGVEREWVPSALNAG